VATEQNEIKKYWNDRAVSDSSKQSTTQDVFLREIELRVLIEAIEKSRAEVILDAGCGDGRTTLALSRHFPNRKFIGFDYAPSMIGNALKNCTDHDSNVRFLLHDVTLSIPVKPDLVYSTRCLINLPTRDAQVEALDRIYECLGPHGEYIMIENFIEGQQALNTLRAHYELAEIPIRFHNNFFSRDWLNSYCHSKWSLLEESNISSSYYMVTRVIYSRLCKDKNIEPNYFDPINKYASLLPFTGEYGPVRYLYFKKL
jgi:ubiquinone/menaquinone biosynthesis C-methylase UbiE